MQEPEDRRPEALTRNHIKEALGNTLRISLITRDGDTRVKFFWTKFPGSQAGISFRSIG
jgi:hypothetical protein